MSKARTSSLITSMFFRAAATDPALATIHPFSPNRCYHNPTDTLGGNTIPAADMRLVAPAGMGSRSIS